MARFDPIVVAEIHQRFSAECRDRPEMFSNRSPGSSRRPSTGLELAAAHRALRDYQQAVRERLADLDLARTPTVPVTAPLIDGPIAGGVLLEHVADQRDAHRLPPSPAGPTHSGCR